MTIDESSSSKATSLMTGVVGDLANGDSGGDLANGDVGNGDDGQEDTIDFTANSNQKAKIDFLNDDVSEMTWGRRIALKLMDKPWYNPSIKANNEEGEDNEEGADDDESNNQDKPIEGDTTARVVDDFDKDVIFEKPCLAKGWAFFEHQSLYRYILPADHESKSYSTWTKIYRTLFLQRNKKFERAEPGEEEDPSRLYPIMTPHNQLGDFGLGIGLYFSNLRALIFISLICGFMSLYNIMYFASDDYDDSYNPDNVSLQGISMRGSAVCASTDWVPCPDCKCETEWEGRYDDALPLERCSKVVGLDYNLTFALKNNCDGTRWQLAASNFGTVVFMAIASLLLGWFMRKEEIKFDEDEQTAQDYSIQIRNPPGDANDPEEWRHFFKEKFNGAQVVVCTCAVENDLLVKALVERREKIRSIQRIEPGTSMRMLDLAKTAAEIKRDRGWFGRLKSTFLAGIPELYDRLVALKGRVEGLAQLEYPVTNVFVTFETEEDQRKVLEELCVGYKNGQNNNSDALSDKKYMFRGEFVLDAVEPEEPSTIRWQDLNASMTQRLKQQIHTLVWTLLSLAVVFAVIYFIDLKLGPALGTFS